MQKVTIKGHLSDWKGLPKNKSLFWQPPGQGIVIGNLTSQLLSNIYLDQTSVTNCFATLTSLKNTCVMSSSSLSTPKSVASSTQNGAFPSSVLWFILVTSTQVGAQKIIFTKPRMSSPPVARATLRGSWPDWVAFVTSIANNFSSAPLNVTAGNLTGTFGAMIRPKICYNEGVSLSANGAPAKAHRLSRCPWSKSRIRCGLDYFWLGIALDQQ